MVKVLSYNIFFKAMVSDPIYENCGPIINDNKYNIKYTNCLKNVSNFAEANKPYDFVDLQEATNWRILQKITPTLSEMHAVSHKPGLDEIVTFYSSKYQLDDSEYEIAGFLEDKNRPFLILFFKNNICIINIHAGHKKDIYKFDYYLKHFLSSDKNSEKIFLAKFKTYDIIMVGDLNDNLLPKKSNSTEDISKFKILSNKIFFNNERILYSINHKPTCCDRTLAATKQNITFDHILSTLPPIQNISTVFPVKRASDHIPIISIITKNIGYDFDGVLHTNVTEPDNEKQRHPINLTGPYEPFSKIIDKIEKDILDGNNVFIITARPKKLIHVNALQLHINSTKLKKYINKISFLYTGGQNKTKIINELGISAFYDDSCLRINELYTAKQNKLLPFLAQLYVVYPEKQSWTLINEKNICEYCESYFCCNNDKNYLINKLNTSNNSNKSFEIINDLIKNYCYKFINPDINVLVKKLGDLVSKKPNQNNVAKIKTLRIDLLKLIVEDINNYFYQ